MPAPLILYNSLSRALEAFSPADPPQATIYSCGPTVYHDAHIGNLRAYVFTDTLSRVLSFKGYGVRHVINITDVGHLASDADEGADKMESAARASGIDIWQIAARYTAAFEQDLRDLNIRAPAFLPRATDHIEAMIAFAGAIEPAHCYRLASGLYFDVTTVPDYGRLARASHDDDAAGRIDAVEGKRHPHDFAVWRSAAPDEQRQMAWNSPWGRGAPGWHLECSVMSRQYLGSHFDIHTGGIDHREIHHPNEIAQNQAYSGTADTGATLWMHNNFLVDRSGKLSKSSGAAATLRQLIALGIHPLAFRLLCLSAQYRSELEFSVEALLAALTRLKRLVLTVEALRRETDTGAAGEDALDAGYRERLDVAVSDDLATPRALPVLDEMLADRRLSAAARIALLAVFDDVLGLALATLTRLDLRCRPAGVAITEGEVEAQLTARRDARAARDFARADALRDALIVQGIEVMDGDPIGWDWRLTS